MLVYGDHEDRVDLADGLKDIVHDLDEIWSMPGGIRRHARLDGALIEAGRLLQGAEDAGLAAAPLAGFMHALAQAAVRSADSDWVCLGVKPEVSRASVSGKVVSRLPEGFAFYAVYPETYAAAARRLRLLGPPHVIGIRSIGTTLGAVVAAALGTTRATNVRPFGDPFARQVELPESVIENRAHYVIVDEGPGQSGSSFGAVADWLEDRGISRDRIAFLPSHDGALGPRASDAHRRRWASAQRQPALFDARWLEQRFSGLEQLGSSDPWQRLSFRGCSDCGPVLIRFAGLGRIGDRKLEMAQALSAEGFVPEPVGLIHGFLIEQWNGDAPIVPPPVSHAADYINARARLFPAEDGTGASLAELLAMAKRNSSLALGAEAAERLARWDAEIERLQRRVRPVRIDGRMDLDRWQGANERALLKVDAVDHHRGHDLIGCQDAAWDVAGAISELGLTGAETSRLIDRTQCDPQLLAFYAIAYEAFRLGQSTLAAEMAPDHATAFQADAKRRGRRLQALLLQCS